VGESKLDLLERLLRRLEHYRTSVTRQDLEDDVDAWLMVSRAMELVAQCCVDLAMTIGARKGLAIPESYREAFVRLAEAGMITTQQSTVLQGWAGLRNVLAHLYANIDLDRLHQALTSDLTPVREFAAVAARELLDDPSS
jgi:uncharacterized protein YutE (UPF0331/DUF86 family)